LVSGLYEGRMLTQAASRVKLSLMDARAWSGWLCWLSVWPRGDDIRKTHRGGCVVVKSILMTSLSMRLTFGSQADVWRVDGGYRDGGGLQCNSCC
jgi:hypothetical protein